MRYTLLLSVVLCAFAYTLAYEEDNPMEERERPVEKSIAEADAIDMRIEQIDEQMRSQSQQVARAAGELAANFNTVRRIGERVRELSQSPDQQAALAAMTPKEIDERLEQIREQNAAQREQDLRKFDELAATLVTGNRAARVNDCEAGRQATGYSRDFSATVYYMRDDPRYVNVTWKLCAASHLSVGSIAEFSVDALHFAPDGSLARIESTNHHSTRCKHIGADVRYARRPLETCTHTQYRTAPRDDAVPGRITPAMECLTGVYHSIPITLTEGGEFDWRVVLYDARGRPTGRLAATTRACDV